MEAIKNELLSSAAAISKPATEAKTKGKSKVETEIERKNQGTKPYAIGQGPRGARADSAEHDHPSRHGDRGSDEDDDDKGKRKPKRYLRKNRVAERYSVNPRSVPRMVEDGRLP